MIVDVRIANGLCDSDLTTLLLAAWSGLIRKLGYDIVYLCSVCETGKF